MDFSRGLEPTPVLVAPGPGGCVPSVALYVTSSVKQLLQPKQDVNGNAGSSSDSEFVGSSDGKSPLGASDDDLEEDEDFEVEVEDDEGDDDEEVFEGCGCEGNCHDSPETCECHALHQGFPYTREQRLRLRPWESLEKNPNEIVELRIPQEGGGTSGSRPLFECHPRCRCRLSCSSRLVARGIQLPLEIFHTGPQRGWGLRSLSPIPLAGTFVCEYAGELLDQEEAERRWKLQEDRQLSNYILSVRENFGAPNSAQTTIIDPREVGNAGRFLNHSCDPNLEAHLVRVGTLTPRIAFFTLRGIRAGEELTFSYHVGEVSPSQPLPEGAGARVRDRLVCHCGAKICQGFLPFQPSR